MKGKTHSQDMPQPNDLGNRESAAATMECMFWREPQCIREGSIVDKFELQENYIDDDHWRRQLLKCRECGQLYFYEMYETLDWANGEDPIFRKYIPIALADESTALLRQSRAALNDLAPCLRVDWPSDIKEPRVYWNLPTDRKEK